MFDHVEPSPGRITSYPGKVDALGDAEQAIIFRSVEVEDTDPAMWPVLEHIEKHGLVLADEITVDTLGFLGGRVVLRWYMTQGCRRDGLVGFDGPDALRRLWERAKSDPLPSRVTRKYRSEYGPAARYNEEMKVVGVIIREEYEDLYNDGMDFMPITKAEQLRRDNPELFWKIIDNDE